MPSGCSPRPCRTSSGGWARPPRTRRPDPSRSTSSPRPAWRPISTPSSARCSPPAIRRSTRPRTWAASRRRPIRTRSRRSPSSGSGSRSVSASSRPSRRRTWLEPRTGRCLRLGSAGSGSAATTTCCTSRCRTSFSTRRWRTRSSVTTASTSARWTTSARFRRKKAEAAHPRCRFEASPASCSPDTSISSRPVRRYSGTSGKGVEMSRVRVLVGTRKGAFVLESDGKRERWDISGPHFGGWEIYHLKGSPADPNRLYAAQGTGWFGQLIQRSNDGGKIWGPVGNKFVYDGVPGTHLWYDGTPHPWEFARVWHLEPSLTDPDTVYAGVEDAALLDRKSTRLNSSHGYISYAVFCLKKKKKKTADDIPTNQHYTSMNT